MPKLYIGDHNNNPVRLKKMWIGDHNNNPVKLKKIWIGDQNNNPVLIFTEGVPDGYTYDFDASFGQYNQSSVTAIVNATNNIPYPIQLFHPILGGGNSWGLSSWDGRPISFNNQAIRCGRGGTFRLPNPVNDATLLLVQRLNDNTEYAYGSFTNSCYFNAKGEYVYNSDYFSYTGAQVGGFSFRRDYNGTYKIGDFSGHVDALSFVNRNLCIYWMYTSGTNISYRIRSEKGNVWTKDVPKDNNVQVQDVRVCDWGGAGVDALTGELYEFIIWPRALSHQEVLDAEEFLLEKWVK